MQAEAAKQAGGGTDASAEAQRAAFQLGQSIRVIAGGAVIAAGYKLVSTLRDAATEIEKVSQSLDKQGDQIVKNAQKFAELSKFARDNSDIIKIGEGALKGVESAHEKLLEESGKELTVWQKIADIWAAGFRDKGPIAQAKELAEAQASQNYQMARTSAIQAIASAKILETRQSLQSYDETLDELTDRMRKQEELAAIHWLNKDIESYLKAKSAAEQYKKEIEALNAVHDKEVKKREQQEKSIQQAGNKAAELEKKAAAAQGTPGGEEAAQQAAQARAEAQRQEAEFREQQRAAARKESDFREVRKYGRVLDPQERAQETIKEREELGQKAGKAQESERQKALEDQMQQQLRGITPEQQRNEREALGVKPPQDKDTSSGIIREIEKLNEKFDRYWQ